MKHLFPFLSALFVAIMPAAGQSQTGGTAMLTGLTKAYEADCNGVGFALWYSPQSDLAHMRDENPEDFARDRLVMVVTNKQQPADRRFAFTEPKPLAGFVQLFRKSGANWQNLTAAQIDPHHTGSASKVAMRFEGVGDSFASTVVYPAFTTITDPQTIVRGDYLLRLTAYPYLEVEGKACPLDLPDLPIRVR